MQFGDGVTMSVGRVMDLGFSMKEAETRFGTGNGLWPSPHLYTLRPLAISLLHI